MELVGLVILHWREFHPDRTLQPKLGHERLHDVEKVLVPQAGVEPLAVCELRLGKAAVRFSLHVAPVFARRKPRLVDRAEFVHEPHEELLGHVHRIPRLAVELVYSKTSG